MLNGPSVLLITDDLLLGSTRAAVLKVAGIVTRIISSTRYLQSAPRSALVLICQSVSCDVAALIAARQKLPGVVVLRLSFAEELSDLVFDNLIQCPVRPETLQAVVRKAMPAPLPVCVQ